MNLGQSIELVEYIKRTSRLLRRRGSCNCGLRHRHAYSRRPHLNRSLGHLPLSAEILRKD